MTKPAKPHILIVDDDRQIRTMLARFLADHGMRVTQAGDGEQMFKTLETGRFDVIVLDVMMPGDDGFTLCRKLRNSNAIPLILLTARNSETDRIVGLELGADDYVTKPFDQRELLARVKNLLRRVRRAPSPHEAGTVRRFLGWTLDLASRTLRGADGDFADLTRAEFKALALLSANPGQVLSRDRLLHEIAHRDWDPADRTVDVVIRRLRQKLGDDSRHPRIIVTSHGEGYLFAPTLGRSS